jgi:hypothetical protein
MANRTTDQARDEFRASCRNAADSQLIAIIEKEEKAGRQEYARIARDERDQRRRHKMSGR